MTDHDTSRAAALARFDGWLTIWQATIAGDLETLGLAPDTIALVSDSLAIVTDLVTLGVLATHPDFAAPLAA